MKATFQFTDPDPLGYYHRLKDYESASGIWSTDEEVPDESAIAKVIADHINTWLPIALIVELTHDDGRPITGACPPAGAFLVSRPVRIHLHGMDGYTVTFNGIARVRHRVDRPGLPPKSAKQIAAFNAMNRGLAILAAKKLEQEVSMPRPTQ